MFMSGKTHAADLTRCFEIRHVNTLACAQTLLLPLFQAAKRRLQIAVANLAPVFSSFSRIQRSSSNYLLDSKH